MYSQHPDIAKRWRKESGPQKNLPEKKHDGPMKGLKGAKPKEKDDADR